MSTATPFTPDQRAAHQLLTELRTRIATQPLPYQHGVGERALESLFEVFALARAAMKDNPGCEAFATLTTDVLNTVLRPVTGKWQKAMDAGRLQSQDGGDAFRAELVTLQAKLREFAGRLGEMAYGTAVRDELVPPPISVGELANLLAPLPYGIPTRPEHNGGLLQATAEAINRKEAASVQARRQAAARAGGAPTAADAAAQDAFGVAFSGGGIRSATFCLGVTQVLADRGLLPTIDFLSTVSGGGYTGSFLSSGLLRDPAIPLGGAHGPDPEPVHALRRRAQYLAGRNLWVTWRMVLETVLGMLLNWSVPAALIGWFACAALLWKRLVPGCHWGWPAGIAAAVAVVGAVGFFWQEHKKDNASRPWGYAMAGAVTVALGALGLWLLEAGFTWLAGDLRTDPALQGSPVAACWTWAGLRTAAAALPFANLHGASWLAAATAGSLVPALLRFLPLLEKPVVRKLAIRVALGIGGVLVPVLVVLTFYLALALGGVHEPSTDGTAATPVGMYWLIGISGVVSAIALLLDINTTSPHRLYRRGLGHTFVEGHTSRRAVRSAVVPLTQLADHGPYHLLNATVNLSNSEDIRLRERGCDFFLMSKHFMGAPTIGYQETVHWKMDGSPPDLATAMAISGAAFSTNMGLGSIRPLRALLAFLNVRLGYWIANPRHRSPFRHPGFLCLLYEMLGWRLTEQRPWLNLSDGGHIENLGVYELLRRRCKFILCVDGESDPGFTFQGLMTLVRHARIDLGVEIRIDLDDLRPDPRSGHGRTHSKLCRIRYPLPDGGHATGLFLYLKLSTTGDEPELIRRYRTNHPEYPHQTTLDQFFDEEQFEAYRLLGVHAIESMFAPCLMEGRPSPTTARDWFERLAKNLLAPA